MFSVSVQHAVEAHVAAADRISSSASSEVFDDEEVVLVGPVGIARLQPLDGGDRGREVLLAAREVVAGVGRHLLHRVALRPAAARPRSARQEHRGGPLGGAGRRA